MTVETPRNVRVVVTDAEHTADFAWLRHAGRQVACGVPEDSRWHVTYPADGRAHITTTRGGESRRGYLRESPVSLDGFTGHRTMLALGLGSDSLVDTGLREFERKTQDAVVFLDLRAFDAEVMWVELGLVEPYKADTLSFDFEVRQLVLVVTTSPWVYIAAGIQRDAVRR